MPIPKELVGVVLFLRSSTHGAFLIGPEALTQYSIEDLARTVLRQVGVREFDTARNFVISRGPPAIGDQRRR